MVVMSDISYHAPLKPPTKREEGEKESELLVTPSRFTPKPYMAYTISVMYAEPVAPEVIKETVSPVNTWTYSIAFVGRYEEEVVAVPVTL
jgi:hypothetical protein